MTSSAHARRAYDHRIRERVCRNEDIPGIRQLRIPRSTRASWRARGALRVVTLEAFSEAGEDLRARVQKLEEPVKILTTLLRLVFALLRISGFRLSGERLPEGKTKESVLRAVAAGARSLPLAVILKILRLAPSRYHAWRRAAEGCGLEDRTSCPRTMPNQLAADEIATIKDMVLDVNLRHMPLRTLSFYAQRVGKVWASVSTWARLIRERGWRRPRFRVHPEKPTLGIRASRPNELWHIDVTILKLLRWQEGLSPRGHRQLVEEDPRVGRRRKPQSGRRAAAAAD